MSPGVIPSAARDLVRRFLAALGMTLLLGVSSAHAAAGQVLFALGRVEIERAGQTFAATRGAPVEVGDKISTGPTGLAQVRLKDGALLSLRYGSTMSVDEFRMPAAAPAAPAGATPAVAAAPAAASLGGRSVLRLLRGAFRTVTGLIGRNVNDAYSVVTPVATIGIRGTDYSAAYCNGDCGTTPDGLYVGVSSGEIELNNDGGQLVLTNDQYGYVKDTSTPPDQEVAPPEVLETPIAAPEEEEESGDTESSEPEPEPIPVADEAPPEGGFSDASGTENVTETGSTQPEGKYELLPGKPGSYAFAAGGFKGANNNGVYTDGGGALNGFLTNVFTNIGTAQNVNQGADESTGLRWGRWTGGVASVGGSELNLANQSLHWIYAETSSTPALRVTGQVSYSLIGNTNPTDNQGNVGFLQSATFNADFTSGTGQVSSTLNIGFGDSGTPGSQFWQASGSGQVSSGTLFNGTYNSVSVTTVGAAGSVSGSGAFNGFFTDGANAAGLTYGLTDGSTTVSGAAAFGNSQQGSPQ